MITEEMLKAAAVEADQVILDSLPAPEECEHEFSNSFQKKIRRISRRANHPVLYKLAKSVACFVLAVILTGGVWLTVDAEAREAFIRWVKETSGTYSVYHFEGTDSGTQTSEGQFSEEEISPEYSLAWIPDGYTEWATNTIGNCICETYVNESGELLNFNYEPSVDSPYWFIETSTSTQQRVYRGRRSGGFLPLQFPGCFQYNRLDVSGWTDGLLPGWLFQQRGTDRHGRACAAL